LQMYLQINLLVYLQMNFQVYLQVNLAAHKKVNRSFHVRNKINRSSILESTMCTYMMWNGISNMEPNVNSLEGKRQSQFHINKVSLGYFYCYVPFCVDYGRDIWMLGFS
jgi:hypothetical protein